MAMEWVFGTILFVLIAVSLSVLSLLFWIFMLIDAIKRKYKKEDDKIIWVVVISLIGVIGAIIYYFAVKREDKK